MAGVGGSREGKWRLYLNNNKKKLMNNNSYSALAGVAQRIERGPANQKVAGLILSQDTCLGCGQVPGEGFIRGNHTLMFLFLSFSFPFPLSKK